MYPPRRAAADASDVGASSSTGSVHTSSKRGEWQLPAASSVWPVCIHIPPPAVGPRRVAASGSSSRRSRSRRTRSPHSTSSSARTRSSAGCGTRCGAGVVLSDKAAPPSADSCCSEILKQDLVMISQGRGAASCSWRSYTTAPPDRRRHVPRRSPSSSSPVWTGNAGDAFYVHARDTAPDLPPCTVTQASSGCLLRGMR